MIVSIFINYNFRENTKVDLEFEFFKELEFGFINTVNGRFSVLGANLKKNWAGAFGQAV